MVKSGYTGISFPFRVSPRGRVVMSTTGPSDPTHIVESLEQIFGTNWLERVMEPEVYSDLAVSIFEPNDASLESVVRSRVLEAVERLEDRVEVSGDGITFDVEVDQSTGVSSLMMTLTFIITKYETEYTKTFNLGEVAA